jgi:membrane protease YdiL (CAAX protease family)
MPHDMTAAPPPPVPLSSAQPIAHWTHTAALLGFLTLTALLGRIRAELPASAGSHTLRYFSTITLEWLLLGSVIAGIYHRREFLLTAFATRRHSLGSSIGQGLVIYCIGIMAIVAVGGALYFTPLFHRRNEAVILSLMPRTPLEFLAWFFVSLTAGACEEIIFRGYLLRQFTAWTQRPIAAIVLTGALFGCLHLYEGIAAIVPLAVLGIIYGMAVRHFKGDLRAVVVAHTLQDFLVALLVLARPFLERYQPHS